MMNKSFSLEAVDRMARITTAMRSELEKVAEWLHGGQKGPVSEDAVAKAIWELELDRWDDEEGMDG